MNLTNKSLYAFNALAELATASAKGKLVSVTEISTKQKIPYAYLEKIFSLLTDAGLIRGIRGRYGGYALVNEAEKITLHQVVQAVGESVDHTKCKGKKNCLQVSSLNSKSETHADAMPCASHGVLCGLNSLINGYLQQVVIKDLMANNNKYSEELIVTG